jgi:hypothetical protein
MFKYPYLKNDIAEKDLELMKWYSCNTEELANYYSNKVLDKFWSTEELKERRVMIHTPLMNDIAILNANLLFSESFHYISEKDLNKDRLDEILYNNSFDSILIESAELCSAFSGIYFKIDIDSNEVNPLINVSVPYYTIPVFKNRKLVKVIFWQEFKDEFKVFRLFETREIINGSLNITYKLYEGSDDNLGREVDINKIEEVAVLNLQDIIIPINDLGVVYIPNLKPNLMYPLSPLGRADCEGLISLLDSLDETFSSWIRDLRLGMARIFVDSEILRKGKFDVYNEVYLKIDLTQNKLANVNYKPIEPLQFQIRVNEHKETALTLMREVTTRAGYAPQSFGMDIEGRAESGTALNIMQGKSLLTRKKKIKYWQDGLEELFWQLQEFDRVFYNGDKEVDFNVTFPSEVKTSLEQTSNTIRNLRQVQLLSNYTSLKLLFPEWSEEEIQAEIDRMNEIL